MEKEGKIAESMIMSVPNQNVNMICYQNFSNALFSEACY